jgi:hypothetical protein
MDGENRKPSRSLHFELKFEGCPDTVTPPLMGCASRSELEFSFHAIHLIELKFTIDRHTAYVVPLRVLSRTNLAGSSPSISCTSSISFASFRLRTLFLSSRSFSHPDPLFSITSALFLQNTRGVGYLQNLPFRISNFRTLSCPERVLRGVPAPVAIVATGFSKIASRFVSVPSVPLWQANLLDRCTEAQKCLFVSPLFATLTHSLSPKSFLPRSSRGPCHSYTNTRDGGTPTLPRRASLPPSRAPRSASIPCALTRLRILPVTTGVWGPPALSRHSPLVYEERVLRRATRHFSPRCLCGAFRLLVQCWQFPGGPGAFSEAWCMA